MPPSVTSLCMLLVVMVATFAPYLVLSREHETALGAWLSTLSMSHQLLIWIFARIASFPFMETLHVAVSSKLNAVGTGIVSIVGEWLGAALQFYIYDTSLAPLLGLREMQATKAMALCLESHPFVFTLLLHLSHVSKLFPWAAAIAVPCIGHPWTLFETASGSAAGELTHVFADALSLRLPWASESIGQLLEPATRWSVDLFLVYWLWQAQRAVNSKLAASAAEAAEPMEADVEHVERRVLRYAVDPPKSPAAKAEEETPKRSRSRGKSASRKRRSVSAGARSRTPGKAKAAHNASEPEPLGRQFVDAEYTVAETPTRRSARLSARK